MAVALTRDQNGTVYGLAAVVHPVIGYSSDRDAEELHHPEGKYSFTQEPVNRIIMNMKRHGLQPIHGLIMSSHVPTSREQVNMIGADIKTIWIENMTKARDDDAIQAMKELNKADIISYNSPQADE